MNSEQNEQPSADNQKLAPMPPKSYEQNRHLSDDETMHPRQVILPFALLLVASFYSSPTNALTGGENGAALSGKTIMILKSNGAVCSGVVIARDAVLTAAHCATGAEQYRIHYRAPNGEAIMLEPAARAVHPAYVANAVKARKPSVDLALFRLKEPLPTSFSSMPLSTRQPHEGATITIGGYGFSKAGDPRSMGVFHTAQLTVREPYGAGKLLIWAKGNGDIQACTGDSGGPLMVDGAVFAITAWADVSRASQCSSNSQGVLLGPQRRWIETTLKGWNTGASWQD